MSTTELIGDRKLAVDRYLDLDLSSGSAAAQDLRGRVTREAARLDIGLTGDGDSGTLCGHLTPAMNGWLADHIVRPRQTALSAAEAAAARIKLTGGVPGIVAKIEEDKLKRIRNQRKRDDIKAFYDRNHARLSSLNLVEGEYLAAKAYEGGREARLPSRWIDFGVPLLILIPELFMNYMSFLKLSGVPAIGMGSSLVVALAIAVSSHMTGTFAKAYAFYMNSDHAGQTSKGLRQLGIALFLLLVALAAVGYARYHMVLEQWQEAIVIGLRPPNIAALTAGLLAGNLLVFAIGAAVIFQIHDENPDYADKARVYFKLRATVETLRRRELTTRIRAIDTGYRHDCDRMQKMAQLMRAQPDTLLIDEMIASIEGKDAEVIGLLNDYRMALCERLFAINDTFSFEGPVTDRYSAQGAERLSLAEFTAVPLHLYRSN